MYGSADGISEQKSRRLHQGSFGIQDKNEPYDRWGSVLATGDFDGDNKTDLVIGAPAEGTETLFRTGAITIISGTSVELTSRDSRTIHQDELDLNLEVSHADHWGDSIGTVDFNGDGISELLVASSSKSIGTQFDSGIITLFWGTNEGILLSTENI